MGDLHRRSTRTAVVCRRMLHCSPRVRLQSVHRLPRARLHGDHPHLVPACNAQSPFPDLRLLTHSIRGKVVANAGRRGPLCTFWVLLHLWREPHLEQAWAFDQVAVLAIVVRRALETVCRPGRRRVAGRSVRPPRPAHCGAHGWLEPRFRSPSGPELRVALRSDRGFRSGDAGAAQNRATNVRVAEAPSLRPGSYDG